MKRNKLKTSNTDRSLALGIVFGVIAATLISVLLTALLANFVLKGKLGESSISAIVFLIRTVSVMAGALIGGMISKEKFLIQVCAAATGYLIVLFAVGIIVYDGSFRHFVSGAVSVITGSAAALMILQSPKIKKHRPVKLNL